MVNKKYLQKKLDNPLPPLKEDERIYLNVPYANRDLAKYCNCGFDREKKLWFTGCLNSRLYVLVKAYGVNEATSEKARKLLEKSLRRGNMRNCKTCTFAMYDSEREVEVCAGPDDWYGRPIDDLLDLLGGNNCPGYEISLAEFTEITEHEM